MSRLNKEIQNVQNPALGAFILWNFVRGYYSGNSSFAPFSMLFIVLPVIYREDLAEVLYSTNKPSGLRYFANKFMTTKLLKNDVISQLHNSAADMKNLTLNSIRIAINASLISIDENALVFPISKTQHKSEPAPIVKIGKAAEKFGYWCSQLTAHEISQILKVRF